MSGLAFLPLVPHWLLASLLVVGAVLVGAGLSRQAAALEPGPTGAAAVIQDGWWNRLQGPIEGEPEGNSVRPLLPAMPAPPTAPPDAIVTGVGAGQIDKVAAVGLEVALPDGVALDALTLHLKESPAAGANVNSSQAQVLACPVTHPWGGHKNASWADRPEADCGLEQVQGMRADDGTWTFDLTPLGLLWTDPDAALPQNGVVLSVDPTSSPGFTQVSWMDFESGNVDVEFQATSASPETYMMAAMADDTSAQASGEPLAPPQAALAAVPRSPSQPRAIRARQPVGFWEDLPTPTALLIPVALGPTLLVGFVLGPSGRPQPVWNRAGGLSRALDRRRGGGGDDAI
jgi:hypothetical protein